MKAFLTRHLGRRIHDFWVARNANAAILFGLAALPLMAAVGTSIDYARIENQTVRLQKAVDAAALALVANAGSLSSAQLSTEAQSRVLADLADPTLSGAVIANSYDATSKVLTVSAQIDYPTAFMNIFGRPKVTLKNTAQATITNGLLPICAMVMSPAAKHTFYTASTAVMKFSDCMTQVNTSDTDAVEAEGTSRIAVLQGESCFVGDIHFGDVSPPKDPSCSFFPDPFTGYSMPSSAATCTYTNGSFLSSGAILNPGTYCGDTTIKASKITLNPGIYIIKDGNFNVVDSSVTATGVTFLLTGADPTFNLAGTSQLTQTPTTSGPFAGFALYLSSNATLSNCEAGNGKNVLSAQPAGLKPKSGSASASTSAWPAKCVSGVFDTANLTTSGTIYLARMAFVLRDSAVVKANQAAIVSLLLLASDSASLDLTPSRDTSVAASAALLKYSEAFRTPRLVK